MVLVYKGREGCGMYTHSVGSRVSSESGGDCVRDAVAAHWIARNLQVTSHHGKLKLKE